MEDPELKSCTPERDFILAIFERALCDVCGKDPEDKRDAWSWLFSESTAEYSAIWWAELVDGEEILKGIRHIARYGHYQKQTGVGWLKKGKFFGY